MTVPELHSCPMSPAFTQMQSFLLVVSLLTLASAFPKLAGKIAFPEVAGYDWQAPTSGDVRSPCPCLNTLANHGYLNRNGMNISRQELSDALTGGENRV